MIAQCSSDDGFGFRDGLAFFVRGGVAVGVSYKGVAGEGGVVGLCSAHEIGAGDFDDFVVLVVFGGVAEGEEHATGGPGEFVACGEVSMVIFGEKADGDGVPSGLSLASGAGRPPQ